MGYEENDVGDSILVIVVVVVVVMFIVCFLG
jgi:hypothetical protein